MLSPTDQTAMGVYREAMPVYMRLGEVPAKRHTQLWRDGRLLTEQVMGMEGFSGNYSILYHLQTPVG